jgi:hypothetical protein
LPLGIGGEVVMSKALAWLMLTFVIGSVASLSADDRSRRSWRVTIQIHDYCRVSNESLTRAREVVTAMYERFGVRTEWMGGAAERAATGSRDVLDLAEADRAGDADHPDAEDGGTWPRRGGRARFCGRTRRRHGTDRVLRSTTASEDSRHEPR